MPYVLIACPVTGDLVPSGLKISSLDELDDQPQSLTECLACGVNHVWEKSEATIIPEWVAQSPLEIAS